VKKQRVNPRFGQPLPGCATVPLFTTKVRCPKAIFTIETAVTVSGRRSKSMASRQSAPITTLVSRDSSANPVEMSKPSPLQFPLVAGGFFGMTGVAIGALGTHRLQPILDANGMGHAWETGSRYQLYHALALLAIAGINAGANASTTSPTRWAGRCWSVGIVLFSGSLYWLALVGPRPYAVVFFTPIGGVALLVGWGCILWAGFRASMSADPKS
jgi:uncharacterized membrane protein YgdD (TMEM256/DUF423 family)